MALTILAIAFVSLFEAHAGAARMAGASADYARARILAQSLLSETVTGWEGEPRPREGRFDRFAWAIEVAPAQGAWADVATEANWRLRHVRVTVSWDRGRTVQLDTLKFGRPPGD